MTVRFYAPPVKKFGPAIYDPAEEPFPVVQATDLNLGAWLRVLVMRQNLYDSESGWLVSN